MYLRGHAQQGPDRTDVAAGLLGVGDSGRNPPDSLPAVVTADFDLAWAVCGSGVLTWNVFRLYRATLHAPRGQFDLTRPFVIDLSYLRRIPAAQIVGRSIDEIRRLSAPGEGTLARWQVTLATLIPDVTLGSRLIGVFEPGRRVVFYSGSQRLGEFADAQFTDAFAAIWLDPDTRSPALRASLLGMESVR